MDIEAIRDEINKNHVEDFEGKNSFYPFFEVFSWVGEIHYLKKDLCIITHFCDLNGIVYARPKPGVIVCACMKGMQRFPLFEEFAKHVPTVYSQARKMIHSPEYYFQQ